MINWQEVFSTPFEFEESKEEILRWEQVFRFARLRSPFFPEYCISLFGPSCPERKTKTKISSRSWKGDIKDGDGIKMGKARIWSAELSQDITRIV